MDLEGEPQKVGLGEVGMDAGTMKKYGRLGP